MHPLHESRKAVAGDAGVLCGVIGRLGSILVITHLPIAWGGMTRLCSTSILETWYNTTRIDGDIFQTFVPVTAYRGE